MKIEVAVELTNPWSNEPSPSELLSRKPSGIADAEVRAQAGELLKDVAARAKQLEKYITDQRRPFSTAANRVTEHFSEHSKSLADLESALKKMIGAYDLEERNRQEAERAAAERARVEEQRRLDAEAEASRQRLQEAAERMDAKGNTEAALKVLEHAESIRPAQVAPAPKTAPLVRSAGSTRVIYRAKVVNELLVPDLYKVVDVAALNKVGQATAGKIVIPGVEWVEETQVAAR